MITRLPLHGVGGMHCPYCLGVHLIEEIEWEGSEKRFATSWGKQVENAEYELFNHIIICPGCNTRLMGWRTAKKVLDKLQNR